MISRRVSKVFQQFLEQFPAIILTGARQTGKTTLTRELLRHSHNYVLLEDLDTRELAVQDPRSFLERYEAPLIIDEFQYAPQLVNYLQGKIDQKRNQTGQYILTGSQNFLMMEQVSQSLAGRAGILSLYPLSSNELPLSKQESFYMEKGLMKLMKRGFYPELWQKKEAQSQYWHTSYVRTFLERDIRNLAQVGDLFIFEKFLKLCAARTGQILNFSDLARDAGISVPTAQRWISILQESYIIHFISPFYQNLSSRVRKAPKLYFLDTGLAIHLMGFRDENTLVHAPQLGALFETLTISDFVKRAASKGEVPEHYYLHTKTRGEIDLMVRSGTKWDLIEIKYLRTIQENSLRQLHKMAQWLGEEKVHQSYLLACVKESFQKNGIHIHPWNQFLGK